MGFDCLPAPPAVSKPRTKTVALSLLTIAVQPRPHSPQQPQSTPTPPRPQSPQQPQSPPTPPRPQSPQQPQPAEQPQTPPQTPVVRGDAPAWTADEGVLLRKLVLKHGMRWKFLADQIPGRSVNAVRNHWQRSERDVIGVGSNYRCQFCGQIKRGHLCTMRDADRSAAGMWSLPADCITLKAIETVIFGGYFSEEGVSGASGCSATSSVAAQSWPCWLRPRVWTRSVSHLYFCRKRQRI